MKIVYHIPPSADPDSIETRIIINQDGKRIEPDGKLRSNGGEFEYEAKAGSSGQLAAFYLDKQQNSSRVMHLVRWDNAEADGIMDLRPDGHKGNVGMRATKKEAAPSPKKEVPLGLSLPKNEAKKEEEPTEENTKPK